MPHEEAGGRVVTDRGQQRIIEIEQTQRFMALAERVVGKEEHVYGWKLGRYLNGDIAVRRGDTTDSYAVSRR